MNTGNKKYKFDQEKVDAEVKIIIERKEQQGASLSKVCTLLHRNHEEIQRILGRRYRGRHDVK